jgi:hypothetical protein
MTNSIVLKGSEAFPQSVKENLIWSIESLESAQKSLSNCRSLDVRYGGNGRYESDGWLNQIAGKVNSARITIDKYRVYAEPNGVDYNRAIAQLGFNGYPELSEKAQKYLNS